MKKVILVLICIVLLVIIGVVGVQFFPKKYSGIENALPEGALVYINWKDGAKKSKELQETQFWQSFRQIDLNALIDKSEMPYDQKALIKKTIDRVTNPTTVALLEKFFGKEVAIAVYPTGALRQKIADIPASNLPMFIEGLLSHVFIATRISTELRMIDFVQRFFKIDEDQVEIQSQDYRGYDLKTLLIKKMGMKIGFVTVKDILFFGAGDHVVKKVIDVLEEDVPSMETDTKFQKVRNSFPEHSDFTSYVDIAKFYSVMFGQLDQIPGMGLSSAEEYSKKHKQIEEAFGRLAGFESAGLSSTGLKMTRTKFNLFYDTKDMDSDVSQFYSSCKNSQNRTVRFVPKEVLGYQWNSCLNLDQYWDQWKKELNQVNQDDPQVNLVKSQIASIEQMLGVSLEKDLLPSIGDEMGGFITDIKVGAMFPIPKFLLFLQIKDQPKIEKILKKLLSNSFFVLQDKTYKNVPLKVFALPLGNDIQPSYAFLDGYLMVALSLKTLESSIDAYQDQALSLTTDPKFKEVDFGLTEKNVSVTYIHSENFLQKIKGVLEWTNDWAASKDQKKLAFHSGSLKRLEDVEREMEVLKEEQDVIREQVVLIEDEIWNLQSKESDTSLKSEELREIEQLIQAKQLEIDGKMEQAEELRTVVGGFKDQSVDPQLRRYYLDEVIYPLFNSLANLEVFGARTTMGKGSFASESFLKIR